MANSNLKIIFWNPRSIVNKREELQKILDDIDIVICVESWLSDKIANFFYNGFKTFRKDRPETRGGGILMLIRNALAYAELDNLKCSKNTIELTGLQITNVTPRINFIVCYNPPNKIHSRLIWDEIFDN